MLLSLVGIISGLTVLYGWLYSSRMQSWTAAFLSSTLATVVTGFLFPYSGFTPAIGVGIIAALLLILAVLALYVFRLSGYWRALFVICSTASLYLNVFVLVVQAFLKVSWLNELAPDGNEPPFAIVQGIVLVAFIAAGYRALYRYPVATA